MKGIRTEHDRAIWFITGRVHTFTNFLATKYLTRKKSRFVNLSTKRRLPRFYKMPHTNCRLADGTQLNLLTWLDIAWQPEQPHFLRKGRSLNIAHLKLLKTICRPSLSYFSVWRNKLFPLGALKPVCIFLSQRMPITTWINCFRLQITLTQKSQVSNVFDVKCVAWELRTSKRRWEYGSWIRSQIKLFSTGIPL